MELNYKISGNSVEYDAIGFSPKSIESEYFGMSVCVFSVKYPDKQTENLLRNYFHIEFVKNNSELKIKKDYNGFKPTDIFVIPVKNKQQAELIISDIKAKNNIY